MSFVTSLRYIDYGRYFVQNQSHYPRDKRGAVFADVTSANIVGYTTTASTGPSMSLGAPFVNVANNGNWKLGQLLPNGIAEGDDFIQFLTTDNAKVYLFATWYNYEEFGEDGGWCNALDDTELLDGLELTPGTAFLSNFQSGNEINYTFSGAVIEPGTDDKVTIAVDGQTSPFIANPLPRKVRMGDITPEGIAEGDDFIQFLTTDNAKVYLFATWYNYEEFGDEGGWCDALDDSVLLDSMELEPGQAFLGNIGEGTTNLKFIFPAAIAK